MSQSVQPPASHSGHTVDAPVLPSGAANHADPLLNARGARYGAFKDNAKIAQCLKRQMRVSPKWDFMDDDMHEALEMIAHKISRILAGDPWYDDSWIDIAGYATRVADRLTAAAKIKK